MSACDFAYADRQAHALVDAQPPQVSGGFHVSRPSITGRCYAHISWKKKNCQSHTPWPGTLHSTTPTPTAPNKISGGLLLLLVSLSTVQPRALHQLINSLIFTI